jgi:hypothetical protein
MSGTWLFYLVCAAGLPVFFYYATVKSRLTVIFFVAVMTLSAMLVFAGIGMLIKGPHEVLLEERQGTVSHGIALTCSGLAILLGAMVSCLLLCGGKKRGIVESRVL